jgi:hypothetical protein
VDLIDPQLGAAGKEAAGEQPREPVEAVVEGGVDPETESEGADRTFSLPTGQDELINEMVAAMFGIKFDYVGTIVSNLARLSMSVSVVMMTMIILPRVCVCVNFVEASIQEIVRFVCVYVSVCIYVCVYICVYVPSSACAI